MYFSLALKNLNGNRVRSAISMLALAIGITSLSLLTSLSSGVKNYVSSLFDAQSPLTEIVVKAQNNNFKLLQKLASQDKKNISPEIVDEIRKIPHVTSAIAQSALPNISTLQIGILGQWLQTDSMVFGAPHELLSDTNISKIDWESNQEPYPAIVSSKLLDLYNYTVAPNNNLPALNEKNFINTEIIILPNKSTFFNNSTNTISIRAKVIGFSDKVNLLGLTISEKALSSIYQKTMNTPLQDYYAINLQVDDAKNVPIVKAAVEEKGLTATSNQDIFNRINNFFLFLNFALSSLSFIILIVAGFNILNTFLANVTERFKDIGILRAIGAQKSDILKLFEIEAALLGFFGSVLGVSIAFLLGTIGNLITHSILSQFIPAEINLFNLEPLSQFGLILFGTILSIFFAYFPSQKAANLDPIQAFSH